MKIKINYIISLGILGSGLASAQISLTASDEVGQSSFNTGANWAGGLAPVAGQTYSTGAFTLLTPADSNSYAFAGDSLTLAAGGGLLFKGSGNLTVPSLILNGGSFSNDLGGVFPLNSGFITAPGGFALNADTTFNFGTASTSRSSISLIGDLSGAGNLIINSTTTNHDPILVIDGNTTSFIGNYVVSPSSVRNSLFLFTKSNAWKPTNTLTSSATATGLMFATTEAASSTIGGTINSAGELQILARSLTDATSTTRRFDMIINSTINCAGFHMGTYNAQLEIAPNTVTLTSSPNINGNIFIGTGQTLNPTIFYLNGQMTDTDLNSGSTTFTTVSYGPTAAHTGTPYHFVWGGDNRLPSHYSWDISNNRTFDLKGFDQETRSWNSGAQGSITINDSTKSGNSRLYLRNPTNSNDSSNMRPTTLEISDVTVDSEFSMFTQFTSNWIQNKSNYNVTHSGGLMINKFSNTPIVMTLSNQSNLTSTGPIFLSEHNDGVLVNIDASSRLSSGSTLRIAGNTNNGRLNIVNVNGGTVECRTLLSDSTSSQLNLNTATIRAMGTEFLANRGLISSEVTTNLTGKNTFDTQGHAAVVRSVLRGGSSDGIRKTGTGSLQLLVANTYTGDTQIDQGSLILNGTSLADASSVVMNGGTLNLTGNETVNKLYFAAQAQPAGTYGSTSSSATFKDDTRFSGTGILTVSNGSSTAEAFFANIGGNFSLYGSDTLPAADPDKDGLNNLLELVLGTNPAAASSNQPAGVRSGNNFIFSFRKTQVSATVPGGITIQPQYSTNLTNWTSATDGVNGVTVSTTVNGYETGVDRVDVSIPQSLAVDEKLFSRLNVTLGGQ